MAGKVVERREELGRLSQKTIEISKKPAVFARYAKSNLQHYKMRIWCFGMLMAVLASSSLAIYCYFQPYSDLL